jgi:four helix bundle protein
MSDNIHRSKHPHKNLEAWKLSMDLVMEIYQLTRNFPKEEQYCIVSQMRRAAISVPSNIAEGSANMTNKQMINFLAISMGSLNELDTQLEISKRLGYIDPKNYETINQRVDRCKSLLYGLKKAVMAKCDK